MRKYIICLSLFICLSSYINSQEPTRRIIDSTKRELNTAKGNKRIDCLNLLAETYYDIWDEDDKQLDTACMYTEEAFKLAKNSGYKYGLGYALLWKAQCYGGRVDNNINNNSTEANYAETYNYANKAIQIGEEIRDYRLVGDVYDMLKWLERWKGDQAKFKHNVEQTIYYYEKPVTKKPTGHLDITHCDQCQGNENKLGWLYTLLSGLEPAFNSTKEAYIQKAITYYQKTDNKAGMGSAYLTLANSVNLSKGVQAGIDYIKKSILFFHESGDERGELQALTSLCNSYFHLGDFENGLDYSKRSIVIAERLVKLNGSADSVRLGDAYYWMGKFYSIAGDYETAFAYMRKAKSYYKADMRWINGSWSDGMEELYRLTGNYDSAMYYATIVDKRNTSPITLSGLYVSMKQYDKALETINSFINIVSERNNLVNLGRIYTIRAKAYYGKNDYENALTNARTSFSLFKKTSQNLELIDNCQLLSDIFNKLGKNDSAYYYLKQYSTLKDSLLNRQLYIRLNDYKKEAEETKKIGQINLLQKDNLLKEQKLQQQILLKRQNEAQLSLLDKSNEIKDQKIKEQTLLKEQNQSQLTLSDKENKLKDQRLKQQAIIRNALLGGLLLFILLGIFVFRSFSLKRKNEKLAIKKNQAELQQKVAELEMQALRAQMNPHFIFNCLSSINKFVLKNDTDIASDYLTRFSRLIRLVLTNSQLSLIPLSDEIEMLRLYLDMERLRFSDSFDYNIIYANTIEPETVYIPPMLLQPFCENAIWHGLMNKEGHRKLEVMMSIRDNQLQCTITDNGIGREKAAELKTKSGGKQKSFGLKITTERLALFNNEKSLRAFYNTEDVVDEDGKVAGTKVILNIKFKDAFQQPVKETI